MCRNKKLTQEKKEEPSDRSVNDPRVLLEKYIVFTSCRKNIFYMNTPQLIKHIDEF